MSSPDTLPYIGSKISLISNKDIRYEGILVSIDTENATASLKSVRAFGTENRSDNYIPPSPDTHSFVVFHGNDIKDLTVCDPENVVSSFQNDMLQSPVVPVASANTSLQTPLPQQSPQTGGETIINTNNIHTANDSRKHQNQHLQNQHHQGRYYHRYNQMSNMQQRTQQQSYAYHLKSAGGYHSRGGGGGGGGMRGNFVNNNRNYDSGRQNNYRFSHNINYNNPKYGNTRAEYGGSGNIGKDGTFQRSGRNVNNEFYNNDPQYIPVVNKTPQSFLYAPYRQRQSQGITSYTPLKDFDFENSNSRFEKPGVNGVSGSNLPELSFQLGGYNKTISFFDNISCETLDRKQGLDEKVDREKQRAVDYATFGDVAANFRGPKGGSRRGGRGMGGYGGRNRGGGFYRGGGRRYAGGS